MRGQWRKIVNDLRYDHGYHIQKRCEHQRERHTHDEGGKDTQRRHAPGGATVALLRPEKCLGIAWRERTGSAGCIHYESRLAAGKGLDKRTTRYPPNGVRL